MSSRYITVAIHTYDKALALRALLESEGIKVELNNVNLEVPGLSSGVRVRIPETDLPLALRIIENKELFRLDPSHDGEEKHSILVPVDFSERSFAAAKIAALIAAKKKEGITFLYSYIDPYIAGNVQFSDSLSYEIGESGAREQMVSNARRLMENFKERFRSAMKKGEIPVVGISQVVVEGVPEDSIIEYAKSSLPSLIVMGTRGADQKESDMIGSVTAEVLDQGRFTVLTVPEPADLAKQLSPTNILFMSNLDQDDILAMDTMYRMLSPTNANVSIVHIPKKRRFSDSSADKAMRRLGDYCTANFKNVHFVTVPVRQEDSEKEFAMLNDQNHYDLIVVPNRRKNAFSRLFNPGLAHKILFCSDIPMLVIPV
ncbi:MAG: universal stress protein [Muribaculaceae bacterium]|nr:universal stress protein [Muribaculaceae bacterium]